MSQVNPKNEVCIVPTGDANTRSVLAAFHRLGVDANVAETAEEVFEAERVVLPGVGSFAAGMQRLRDSGFDVALQEHVRRGRSLLAISLGLHLLLEGSEESPRSTGLGIVPGVARRLDSRGGTLPQPQIGWSRILPDRPCRFLFDGWAFFANTFALESRPEGFHAAFADYGGRFVAGFESAEVVACQFHPELSGGYGRRLLRTWLEGQSPTARGGPTIRVIPSLDVENGRVVRRVHMSSLDDAGDPLELASAYELQGADEIVVTDVSATRTGHAFAVSVVRDLRSRLAIPLTVVGGAVGIEDARRLFDAGADKVAIDSRAITHRGLLSELVSMFGRQCIVLAIDAAVREGGGWNVLFRGGQDDSGQDVIEWVREGAQQGAGEILLSSRDRDGTKRGYDLELIRAVREVCSLPLVVSGGAASPAHMQEAIQAGATAVLAASIFHDDEHSVASIKGWLARRGVPLRP
ncbi:MAG: imidazole glycerol phosphate synthase subunit HisF [Planctomycetes bacterium]|nr:imidazole glycerol phosphate synthase subunit HisF [Planctomycetota bacterium]